MGITRTDYIVHGWKLPASAIPDRWDEKLLPYVEGHPGIRHILIFGTDSKGERYAVFGYDLAMNEEGWDFTEIQDVEGVRIDNLPMKDHLQWKVNEVLGFIPDNLPTTFIFSHFG